MQSYPFAMPQILTPNNAHAHRPLKADGSDAEAIYGG
jgi:hypothetical protein